MAENKLSDIIGTSLEKIKALADGQTVLGDPISTPGGTTVIPVSKVAVGFASGGLDYHQKGAKDEPGHCQDFGGGGGTGLTVTPIAFLVISPSGNVELLPITTAEQVGTLDKVTALIERSPDILEKLKKVFFTDTAKKSKTEEKPEKKAVKKAGKK